MSARFELDKFDGKGDFSLWKKKMKALLVQQKVARALEDPNDILIASNSIEEIQWLKNQLSTKFEMKDLGTAKKILGMQLSRDRVRNTMSISQEDYLKSVVKRFHMEDCKTVKTPLAQHFKLSAAQSPTTLEEIDEMKTIPYANLVGSIMYGMISCRPNLAHSMSIISRYMSNAGKTHWEASKWVLRYIKGTTAKGLIYTKCENLDEFIVGYEDSDYAADLDRRRSLTGYVFSLFGNVISWKSTLQSVVALFSTEAEYIALADSVKESMWLKGLISKMCSLTCSVKIYCDSQSAIALSKNPMFHNRTKHIDIRFHYVRDALQDGKISLLKINTAHNLADMMTKSLASDRFLYLCDLLKLGVG